MCVNSTHEGFSYFTGLAYMVEKENIDPSRILALTFSKEASRNPGVYVICAIRAPFNITLNL